MSNVNPNDPNAPFNDPDALTRGDVQGDPATAEQRQQAQQKQRQASQAQQKAAQERDADLDRLAELQKEYVQVREQAKQAATPAVNPGAAALARKGDIIREMDVIKRKHNLS